MLNRILLNKYFLLFLDVISFYLILLLSLFIRYGNVFSHSQFDEIIKQFSILLIFYLFIFYIFQMYSLAKLANQNELYERIIYSFVTIIVITIVYFYFQPFSLIAPKTLLAIFSVLYAIYQVLFRSLAIWLAKFKPENLLLIGSPLRINEILQEMQKNYAKSKKVFVYTDSLLKIDGNYIFIDPPLSNLYNFLANKKIDKIIIDSNFIAFSSVANFIFLNFPKIKSQIWEINSYYEHFFQKIFLDVLGKRWFLFNLNRVKMTFYQIVKRCFDVSLSLIVLVFFVPLWPIIALLVKMSSPGPIFFMNQRVGRNNQIFKLIKFRSMKVQEKQLQIWAQKDDPRITKIGKFLRESRLDELPQVFNILKGDLSFVGPRPEQPEIVQQLIKEIPFYNQRHLIKPGLTGWAQINYYYVSSVEDTKVKLQYDLFYIKNRSLILDMRIILKTISTMLLRKGR